MDLVAVKAPAAGVAFARSPLEFFDAAFGVVPSRDRLQIIADKLIETLAEGHCFLAGAGDELVVDGQGDVHEHSICGHWLCVDAGRDPLGLPQITPVRFVGGNQDLGDSDLLRQPHLCKPTLLAKTSQRLAEGFPAEIQRRFLHRCFLRHERSVCVSFKLIDIILMHLVFARRKKNSRSQFRCNSRRRKF